MPRPIDDTTHVQETRVTLSSSATTTNGATAVVVTPSPPPPPRICESTIEQIQIARLAAEIRFAARKVAGTL